MLSITMILYKILAYKLYAVKYAMIKNENQCSNNTLKYVLIEKYEKLLSKYFLFGMSN